MMPALVESFPERIIGASVRWYDILESTSSTAFDLNEPGLAIVADHQTAGRGQYQRSWAATKYSSLLMSVSVDPPTGMNRPCLLIAWAAVNVAETIDRLTGLNTRLKWPNDLLIDGKKVCGILTECRGLTVIGIGLNLTQEIDEFVEAGLPEATSLRIAAGVRLAAHDLVPPLLDTLDADYRSLAIGKIEALEARWRGRIGLIGRDILLETASGDEAAGRLLEMSFHSLVLEEPDGAFRRLSPESIRHLKAA